MKKFRKNLGKKTGLTDIRMVAGENLLPTPTDKPHSIAQTKSAQHNGHQDPTGNHTRTMTRAPIADNFCSTAQVSDAADPRELSAMHHDGHTSAPLPNEGVPSSYQPVVRPLELKKQDQDESNLKPASELRRGARLSHRGAGTAIMQGLRSKRAVDHMPSPTVDQKNVSHSNQGNEVHAKSTGLRHQDHQSTTAMTGGVRMTAPDHISREPDAYQKSRKNSLSQAHTTISRNNEYSLATDGPEFSGNVNSKQLANAGYETKAPIPGAYDTRDRSINIQGISRRDTASRTSPLDPNVQRNSYLAETHSLLMSGASRSMGIADGTAMNDDEENTDEEATHDADSDFEGHRIDDDDMTKPMSLREEMQSPQTPREQLNTESEDAITIENLKAQVHMHQQDCARVRKLWQGAVDDLVRFRQESTSKVDDQSLRAAYREILFVVQNWATTYCHMEPYPRLSKRNKTHLKRLTPAWRTFMSRPGTCLLLIQSVLINWLSSEVLTCNVGVGLWWAAGMQESLSTLCTQLDPSNGRSISNLLNKGHLEPSYVREYAAWRARTAHLVSKSVDPRHVEINVTAICTGLEKFLAPFVMNEKKEDAWVGLRTIVRQAFSLDEDLCKSRALFTAHNWNDTTVLGCGFDAAIMEPAMGSRTPQPGMAVDLVLAPALTKTGTADGDMYEKTSFISKWIVVCSESSATVGQKKSLVPS